MKLEFLALAGLGSLVAAPPIDGAGSGLEGRSTSVAVLATFDDLTPGPVAALNFVPVPYNYLNFSAFIFQSAGTAGLAPGVIPHSPPNYAGNGEFARVRAGNPTITIEGTNATSFGLKSFWYGCYITQPLQQGQISTTCTIAVTGVKLNGDQTPPKSFSFAKDPSLTALMEEATFDSTFNKLSSAIIEITTAVPTALTTDVVVDSIKYIVYKV